MLFGGDVMPFGSNSPLDSCVTWKPGGTDCWAWTIGVVKRGRLSTTRKPRRSDTVFLSFRLPIGLIANNFQAYYPCATVIRVVRPQLVTTKLLVYKLASGVVASNRLRQAQHVSQ